MIEVQGDILSSEILQFADAVCFTANGILKNNNALVMGGGVAKVFRDRFLALDAQAGVAVKTHGNICQVIRHIAYSQEGASNFSIVAFPTKNNWRDPSDPLLIEQSAKQLRMLADQRGWKIVYLPRPGCNLGGLNWRDIKPIVSKILDNRFYCITYFR